MKLEILNTAVVVTAQEHNPTVLQSHFLQSEQIVPSDWQLAEPPFCSSGVSRVRYANGIIFEVNKSRFQVKDEEPSSKPGASMLNRLALEYVKRLPYVHYLAVGINADAFVEISNPEEFLVERFLKSGEWNSKDLTPYALGLHLVYTQEHGDLHIYLDPGVVTVSSEGSQRKGIVIRGNLHHDLQSPSALTEIEEVTGRLADRLGDLERITKLTLGLEED